MYNDDMKKSSIIASLIAVVIVIIGIWIYTNSHQPAVVPVTSDYSDLIQVDSPKPNATVASPLVITGKARGSWYFEASFPVKLVGEDGTVVAEAAAQANPPAGGEWMTADFVPFKATLTFARPTTRTGTLILKNDNPSGDPARDKEIKIPVQFQSKGEHEQASFGTAFTMSVGDRAVFSNGLEIGLTAINDSRCKPDVQCVWQGELAPLLRTQSGLAEGALGPLREVRLGTVNNQSVVADGYSFTLQSATESMATILVTQAQAIQ